ncbi:hypothetical protein HII31_03816 [Pseudocercospora fuligena]|uniref:Uncharacterized protein n=1 Tax=Pseudocercospora fuligena TaxID=685502 RepID=A0A8H6RRE8_9PEZI|nr:hypothetical protein HII31_03816 [Pseudocercospora fuligena]
MSRPSTSPLRKTLRQHLESLPQELYDQIYEEAFTAPNSIIHITRHTIIPYANLREVSRASRQKYLESLGESTTFCGQSSVMGKWLHLIDWAWDLRDVRVFLQHGPKARPQSMLWPSVNWDRAKWKLHAWCLRRLLKALPQELYDIIYDMTFTASPSIIAISSSHTRPEFTNLIQVSSSSRRKYIQSLCTNTVFIGQQNTVGIWLGTLEWRNQLQDVRVFFWDGEPPKPYDRPLVVWPSVPWNFAAKELQKRGSAKVFKFETQSQSAENDDLSMIAKAKE